MRRAFYGGSFDPFTLGHLFVVCQALQSYDQVIIGVGKNSKKTSKFSVDEKIEMIEKSIADLVSISEFFNGSVKVFPSVMMQMAEKISKNPDCIKIITYDGLTVDVAVKNDANVLIRGVRTTSDCNEETSLRHVNEAICKLRNVVCPTVLVNTSSTEVSHISSTMVKKLMEAGEYIIAKSYVMPSAHDVMCRVYLRDVYSRITKGDKHKAYDYLCEKAKDGFQRFSSTACDLNMLNIFRTHNPSYDMSVITYDLVMFWSPLINEENVDENAYKFVAGYVAYFDSFVKLCKATNFITYSEKREVIDEDASKYDKKIAADCDVLCDICMNHFVYQPNCLVNLWQKMRVAQLNEMSDFEFLYDVKFYCEKITDCMCFFKTKYFLENYKDVISENIKEEIKVLDILLKKYQTD